MFEENRSVTCCFTGHRNIPLDDEYEELEKRLEDEIENLIHQGIRYFAVGGARGFDTMAATAVLVQRCLYLHIQLILILPCKDQTNGWDRVEKTIYNLNLRDADEVVYISESYSRGCMQRRNRRLVDSSSVCVCYLTDPRSGTGYTVNYAKRKGLRVINLA